MNSEWVEITKKQNKIYVSIKLPLFDRYGSVGRLKITRAMVERLLVSRKEAFDKFIEGPLLLKNTEKGSNQATWVFECVKKIKRITPVKKKARRTRKKVEKVLDKSPEDVIIEVEKKETITSSEAQSVTEE